MAAFCDYSKMNFKAITGKNQMRHMDATKAKLINKRVAVRSSSPKKRADTLTYYRLVLDIVLTAPTIPKTPTPVTPPPTRATSPEPESVTTSTRTITIYGRECEVELPTEMDIYEGLRLHYPLLYTMVLDEEKEIAYASKIAEHEYEHQMSYMDYLEWMYD
jgi:hypothetical protein